jgi:hypothetical protein
MKAHHAFTRKQRREQSMRETIEIVDRDMAAVLRAMTEAERLRIA